MKDEKTRGTWRNTRLSNESDDYLSRREELRLAEIELMRQRERVAELRRQLPERGNWYAELGYGARVPATSSAHR